MARWNPEDGVTVVKQFDAGAGRARRRAAVRRDPGLRRHGQEDQARSTSTATSRPRRDGGRRSRSRRSARAAARFEVPAVSLVVRPDGSVVVRNQASDLHDEVRKDMAENYKRELEGVGQEATKRDAGYDGMRDGRPRCR